MLFWLQAAAINSSLVSMFLIFESFSRSSKPNNFLVAPEGLCQQSKPDVSSPIVPKRASELTQEMIGYFRPSDGWRDLEYDIENHRISVVAITPLLRFKDDIDILVIPDGENAQIAMYGRSRVGYSDLGTNRKRVLSLIDRFQQ